MKLQRPRLLVIDDNAQIQKILTNLLRNDFLISTAGEGFEGYSRALSHRPDIVILDYEMPGWDGLQTLRAFRENPRLADIPILMLTACSDKETAFAIIGAGANAYLLKTRIEREELVERLESLLPTATR